MKRMQALASAVAQRPDSGFMGNGRIGEWPAPRRFGRILAATHAHVKSAPPGVVRLEHSVFHRPRRGDPVRVANFIEVPLAQPHKRRRRP